MNWRELITSIYGTCPEQPGIASKPAFFPAASAQDIAAGERAVDAEFPPSLRSLLSQTNGVMCRLAIDKGEWFDDKWLVWTIEEIVEQNAFFRGEAGKDTYECDFRDLVFFANAGCDGILFGFPVTEERACGPGVVAWHPIEVEVTEIAPSLEEFLKGWLAGTISV